MNNIDYRKLIAAVIKQAVKDNAAWFLPKISTFYSYMADLFGNPFGSLTRLAVFGAKTLQNCDFHKEIVQELKFPNNSITPLYSCNYTAI